MVLSIMLDIFIFDSSFHKLRQFLCVYIRLKMKSEAFICQWANSYINFQIMKSHGFGLINNFFSHIFTIYTDQSFMKICYF